MCIIIYLIVFVCPQVIEVKQVQGTSLQLTEEGARVAENGSYEALVFKAVPENGITQAELMVYFP